MKIKHLELQAACQHRHLEIDFRSGLIGIVGPNGSGKSNLVKMIEGSLTNDFQWKGRTREQQVNRTVLKKDAFVKSVWEHGGTEFGVERWLRPNKNRFTCGDVGLAKQSEIGPYLWRMLGVTERVIKDYVFVDQHKIFDFLNLRDAERAKSFAYLCGAEHSEKIWDCLGDVIKDDRKLLIDLSGEIETESTGITQRSVNIRKQLKMRGELVMDVLSPTRKAQCDDIVKRYNAGFDKQHYLSLRTKIKVNGPKLARRSQKLATETQRLADLVISLGKQGDKRRRYVKILSALDRWKQFAERRRELKALVAAEPPAAPAKPDCFDEVDTDFIARLSNYHLRLDEANQAVRIFDENGAVECPTCGTLRSDLGEYLNGKRKDTEELPERICEMMDKKSEVHRWNARMEEHRERLAAFEATLEASKQELKSLPRKPKLPNKEDRLRKFIDEHIEMQRAEADLAKWVEAEEEPLQEERFRLNADKLELERVEERRKETPSKEEYEEAKQQRDAHNDVLVAYTECKTVLQTLRDEQKTAKAKLEKLQHRHKKGRNARRWIKEAEGYREVLHRANLPTEVMIDALDDVMEDVNDNLGKFSVPFTVSIGGDLEITVHNDDGTTEPARGKSGGEMVVLAICFRLAVSSHFAGDLGMMVLDEPTDNLDDIRMEHLARMLREVCTVAEKRGQQIIVITHDKRLVSAFNQTITL